MALEALTEDELKYASHPDPRYGEWLQKHRDNLDLTMRVDKFELADNMAQKRWRLELTCEGRKTLQISVQQ